MRILLLIVGVLVVLMGLIWTGQGLGYINWPQSSFMLKQTQWAYYGGGTALAGLILIWLSRRS
uniref:Uncharacterized protein n=1 Tax=Rhodopseudomonas palustris (strain BisA53) TaxID=316055 RepID=Q07ME3_RHOP5